MEDPEQQQCHPPVERKPWRDLFSAALLELDRSQLAERIASARAAIERRTEELVDVRNAYQERTKLRNALDTLKHLHDICLRRPSA